MYESPITVYTQLNDVLEEVHKKQEEYVYNYLFEIGVNVDKEELIKALQYDREQYTKGYRDGMQKLAERLTEKATSYMNEGSVSVNDIEKLVKEMLPAEKLATESDARDIENYEIAHRVRAEAIKEFAERLKARIREYIFISELEFQCEEVDNLVKEMTE